jgi:hypothetical protein
MNQKGWTEYTDERFKGKNKIRYNQDSAGIQHSIDKGAKYLIINGMHEIYDKAYLQSYCRNLKGKYRDVLIFDLKSKLINFNVRNRLIEKTYHCSAESLAADHYKFVDDADTLVLFDNGDTRTDEFAHAGKYACKLSSTSPYGMTIKLKDLKEGESLSIMVWRKIKERSSAVLVASANTPKPYYNADFKIISSAQGWEKLSMEVHINSELARHELVIYAYNPDPEPVYFDDLEIVRYGEP